MNVAAKRSSNHYLLAVPTILVSVLQVAFFALDGPWKPFTIIAIGFSIVNLLAAAGLLLTGIPRYQKWIFAIYCVQLVFFVFRLFEGESIVVPRLLVVALILCHAAILLSMFLGEPEIFDRHKAILLSFSLSIAVLVCEIILGHLSPLPAQEGPVIPLWVGKMNSHPALGTVFPPNSKLYTSYPSNPRGYFRDDPRAKVWLRVAAPATADLFFPEDQEGVARIVPHKLSNTISDIQLNMPDLQVRSGYNYAIRFRARADHPRNIVNGFARAHDPWTGLGYYKTFPLTEQWKTFQEEFVPNDDEQNARIHFDIGADLTPVEFSSIELRSVPDQTVIEPTTHLSKYSVSYRFNSLGCRGPDSPIPRPSNMRRVLLLGDSYTLGSGVYELDTFASKLQNLLNKSNPADPANPSYDVVNCGVSGYGTREERLFYELVGVKYDPQVVILTMVWNDDISFLDEVKKKYVNRPSSRLERLFYTWAKLQDLRHKHPSPDFTKCVEDILRLDGAVRKNNGRLMIVIFRNNPDFEGKTVQGRIWKRLDETVRKGVADKQIPVLDLGKALFEKHSTNELQVFPEVDYHPNEVAHAIAAREIFNFLERNNFLRP